MTPIGKGGTMKETTMTVKRIRLIDELRGFAIILMVVYHFLYSLAFVYGFTLQPWVLNAMVIVQPFGAGLFITIAGISSCFSHSNWQRGLKVLLVAILISVATYIFLPDQAIYFGVLHFYGVAILLFAASRRLLERIPPVVLAIVSGVLFYTTWNLRDGFLTLPFLGHVTLPASLYSSILLAPLGLPPASFSSSDFFPLLPWLPIFLIGTTIGREVLQRRLPAFCYRSHIPALTQIGQHSMLIYIVHQPAILGTLWLVTRLILSVSDRPSQ